MVSTTPKGKARFILAFFFIPYYIKRIKTLDKHLFYLYNKYEQKFLREEGIK